MANEPTPTVLVYIPVREVWKIMETNEYPTKWTSTPYDLSLDMVRTPFVGVNITVEYFIKMVEAIKKAEADADDLPF